MIDLIAKLNGLIQITAFVVILIRAFLNVREVTRSVTGVFFMFAIITRFAGDLYYWAYVLLNKGYYPPFSALDLTTMGMFLLFGATAHSLFPERTNRPGEIVLSAAAGLFGTANVFLWGYYSGAWFQDIFSGITFIYLMTVSTLAIYRTGALKKDKWVILGFVCLSFVANGIVVPLIRSAGLDLIADATDGVNYVIMFGTFVWLTVKIFRSFRRYERDQALALCFGLLCWTFCTLYMCSEPFYQLALSCETFQLILMWFIIERRVKAAA